MRELSIEEKAQRYDEAIERAESIYNETAIPSATTKGICTYIFPELKESEDERIREVQLDYWRSVGGKEWHGVPVQEVIAWLEKQSEQRSKLVDFDLNANDSDLQDETYFIPNGFHAEIIGDKVVIKKGEQKPWSEEDEETLKDIITSMTNLKDSATSDALRWIYDSKINWLESLKGRYTWKPSDEQMGVIEAVINNRSFQRRHLDSLYADLKKLREE